MASHLHRAQHAQAAARARLNPGDYPFKQNPQTRPATHDSCDGLPCVNVTTSPITPERSRSCPPAPGSSGSSAPTAATSAHHLEPRPLQTAGLLKTNTRISPPTPPPPSGTDNDSTARTRSASSPNADKPAETAAETVAVAAVINANHSRSVSRTSITRKSKLSCFAASKLNSTACPASRARYPGMSMMWE